MMSGAAGIFDKLQKLDSRIYFWLIVVVLTIPALMPIGIPVPITITTQKLFNGIKEVKQGDVVLIDIFMQVGTWAECLDGLVVETKMLTDQGAKIVVVSNSMDCALTWERLKKLVPALTEKYVYGTDVVFLGYYAGEDAACAQMAKDMMSVFPKDYYGTPTNQIPLIQAANTADKYRMILLTAEGEVKWIQQWGQPYKIPIGQVGIAMKGSILMPYINSGDLFGLAIGVRGGAELEQLYKQPAGATKRMDAINLSHITVVALIVVANVGYLVSKRTKVK